MNITILIQSNDSLTKNQNDVKRCYVYNIKYLIFNDS